MYAVDEKCYTKFYEASLHDPETIRLDCLLDVDKLVRECLS